MNKELCGLHSVNTPGLNGIRSMSTTRRRKPSYLHLKPVYEQLIEEIENLLTEYNKCGLNKPTENQIPQLKGLFALMKRKRDSLIDMGEKLNEILTAQGAVSEIQTIKTHIQRAESTVANIRLSHPDIISETTLSNTKRKERNDTNDQFSVGSQERNEPLNVKDARVKLQMQIASQIAEDRVDTVFEHQVQQLHSTNAQIFRIKEIEKKRAELQVLQNAENEGNISNIAQKPQMKPNEDLIRSSNFQYDNHDNVNTRPTSDTEWSPDSQNEIHMLTPTNIQQTLQS